MVLPNNFEYLSPAEQLQIVRTENNINLKEVDPKYQLNILKETSLAPLFKELTPVLSQNDGFQVEYSADKTPTEFMNKLYLTQINLPGVVNWNFQDAPVGLQSFLLQKMYVQEVKYLSAAHNLIETYQNLKTRYPKLIAVDANGKAKLVFYQIPYSFVETSTRTKTIMTHLIASELIARPDILNKYSYRLETELVGGFSFLNYKDPYYLLDGNPNASRVYNLTLGAWELGQYLLYNGYTLESDPNNQNNFIFKAPPPQSQPERPASPQLEPIRSTQQIQELEHIMTNIKTKFNLTDKLSTGDDFRTTIDLEYLRKTFNSLENMEKIKNSLIDFYRWKSKKYEANYKKFRDSIEKDQEVYQIAKLTPKELEDVRGDTTTAKMLEGYLILVNNRVKQKLEQLQNMTNQELQKDYLEVIDNPNWGLITIQDEKIKNQISIAIISLLGGYQAFSLDPQNAVITAPAGAGKTRLATTIAKIYQKLGILATDLYQKATRADLVASFAGQTAPKTKRMIFRALEGVLFIDEAYQIAGCPTADGYGAEAITEIVNFVEDYIGLSIVIVAGYEKEMNECFFGRNEGLKRRFPNKFKIQPLGSLQLTWILVNKILEDLGKNIFSQKEDQWAIYLMINNMNEKGLFPSLSGDVIILGSKIIRYYLAGFNILESIRNGAYEYMTIYQELNQADAILLINIFDQAWSKL